MTVFFVTLYLLCPPLVGPDYTLHIIVDCNSILQLPIVVSESKNLLNTLLTFLWDNTAPISTRAFFWSSLPLLVRLHYLKLSRPTALVCEQKLPPNAKVLRGMTNTCCAVKEAATVYASGKQFDMRH